VNLIPQYFRSQRQIIIDTEKLIADQPTLAVSEFRNRANNLAIDQQLLRQRYGEFLGEEADHAAEPAEASGEHEEHSPDDGHDHGPPAAAGAPQTQQEIMEEYGHQHDSQDEATLFDRETKGTMRQALAAMWEAERFLRVAQPREALGPENRALEIIKALQQADRSYVQRVGFEAAPIDFAARRLRGEVDDVPERIVPDAAVAPGSPVEADIREVLGRAPWRRTTAQPLTADEVEALRRIEPALMNAANENTGLSLGALEELRRLAAGEALAPGKQSALEAALLQMLPTRSGGQRERIRSRNSPTLTSAIWRVRDERSCDLSRASHRDCRRRHRGARCLRVAQARPAQSYRTDRCECRRDRRSVFARDLQDWRERGAASRRGGGSALDAQCGCFGFTEHRTCDAFRSSRCDREAGERVGCS
jgi:hypothetical protein